MKLTATLVICILIFMSCSKKENKLEELRNSLIYKDRDDNIFKNGTDPKNENFMYKFIENFTILGENEDVADTNSMFLQPLAVDTDKNGNIYILDRKINSVLKYDDNGKYIMTFGGTGNGPGELQLPIAMVTREDTVFVNDLGSRKVNKYYRNGEFISSKDLADGVPMHMKTIGKDRFIGIKLFGFSNEKGEYTTYDLVLMNQNFETIKVLNEFKILLSEARTISFLDYLVPCSWYGDEIFVSVNSEDQYKINVFDFDGNKKYSIEKSYRKLQMSDLERKEFDDIILMKNNGQKITGDIEARNKKAINGLYHDRDGRLIVIPSIERDQHNMNNLYFDVFDKGEFQNRVLIDNLCDGHDFFNLDDRLLFKGVKLYHLKISEMFLKVYDYEIENK
ncbi:MAG: 6-bladed beta-propeller [Candidatus Delongbacteria bacterium]|nr:6-bladed beta-propeller [Candidatus Delongbacteria bacterium]MBN2833726.1 6-bladed beta-propeller [Candidatus Delongbacteria bacterium]